MNANSKPDWIIIAIVSITIIALAGVGISDYLSYLSVKQQNETIRTAITNKWTIEQIQGLVNSKE